MRAGRGPHERRIGGRPRPQAPDRSRRAAVYGDRRLGLAVRLALRCPACRTGRHPLLVHRRRRRRSALPRLRRAWWHAARCRRNRTHPLLLAWRHERLHGRLAVLDRLRGDRPNRSLSRVAVRLELPAVAHRDQRRRPGADAERSCGRGGAAARIPAREPLRRALARARQHSNHGLEARDPGYRRDCADDRGLQQRQLHEVRLRTDGR